MPKTVKVRPDRYTRKEQALAYHASTGASGRKRLSQRLELSAVARALDTTDGARVLDVPCGTGRIDPLLRGRFAEVYGVDSSVPMLSVLRQSVKSARACCGDIFQLPFDDDAFDWVVCHRYLHHLHSREDRVRALSSLARIARRGVICYAWIDTPLLRRRSSMRASISRHEADRAAAAAGLTVDRVFRCSGPFSVKAILRLLPASQ